MNEKTKEVLRSAYDRTCEATSDLSAAMRSEVSTSIHGRIIYAYSLSHDLQRVIKEILENA